MKLQINSVASKPVPPSGIAVIILALLGCCGWMGMSWWQQKGAPIRDYRATSLLTGENKVYFIYDTANTTLPAPAMISPLQILDSKAPTPGASDFFSEDMRYPVTPETKEERERRIQKVDSYYMNQIVPIKDYAPSIRLNTRFVGHGPVSDPGAKIREEIDAAIPQTIKRAIESENLTAEESRFGDNHVSFWDRAPLKPARVIVTVRKRFERRRCLFAVQAQLQREGKLAAPTAAHVYATVKRSVPIFQEVPENEARQAIENEVATHVAFVVKSGLQPYRLPEFGER